MKTILKLISALLLIVSCTDKTAYHIHGSFKDGASEEWIYLSRFMDLEMDSAKIVDGVFEFKGNTTFPELHALSYGFGKEKGFYPLFVEPGNIKVVIDDNNWEMGSTVMGGEVNNTYQDIQKKYQDDFIALFKLRDTAKGEEKKRIQNKIEKLEIKRDDQWIKYINKHPESPISICLFSNLYFAFSFDTIGAMLNRFTPEIKQTTIYKSLYDNYTNQLKLANSTPAFELNNSIRYLSADLNENSVIQSLSQMNPNKAMYIDIWATWCGPCRNEFPYSKKLAGVIDTSKVAMVYLCLDSKEEEWKSVVEEAQLSGQHLLINDALAKKIGEELGGIQGIPRYAIVDKNGKIVNNNAPWPESQEIVKLLSALD